MKQLITSAMTVGFLLTLAGCTNFLTPKFSNDASRTVNGIEDAVVNLVTADTEFDATDAVLFETIQYMAAQGSLWNDSRSFNPGKMPVYLIRRTEAGEATKAYLVNFTSLPEGAIEIQHPYTGIGSIYRYDGEMGELSPSMSFGFALDLSGRPTFAMEYKPSSMDKTSTSSTCSLLDQWTDTFIHELFHHYQFHSPDNDWVSLAFGGLSLANYPVTTDNLALSMLEKYVLLGGRNSTSVAEKQTALRRLQAIRTTRTMLPEAAEGSHYLSAIHMTSRLGIDSPNGIGQSFVPGISGKIEAIKVAIGDISNPNIRLEIWNETNHIILQQVQLGNLSPGENTLNLAVPLAVEKDVQYSFRVFPSKGYLSLCVGDDTYAGGKGFYVINDFEANAILGIANPPDLVFEIKVSGRNYIDLMDRFQERNEGSAVDVANQFLRLTGNSKYLQERLELFLDRVIIYAGNSPSRQGIINTFFYGGWYGTGCTIMELLDAVYGTSSNYRNSFPSGGNPMAAVETLCGPLSQDEMDELVTDAKATYNWQAILEKVAAMKAAAGL